MPDEHKAHGGFLTGLVVGGIIGAALTLWLVEKSSGPGRRMGIGGTLSDITSFIREDVLGGVKDVIKRTIEEGRETAQSNRMDIEERLRGEEQ